MLLRRTLDVISAKLKIPLPAQQIGTLSVVKIEQIRWCWLHSESRRHVSFVKNLFHCGEKGRVDRRLNTRPLLVSLSQRRTAEH